MLDHGFHVIVIKKLYHEIILKQIAYMKKSDISSKMSFLSNCYLKLDNQYSKDNIKNILDT